MKEFLEKLFKWGIGALFFITPLAYLPTWASPYVTAKLFFFLGSTEALAAVWLWLLILDDRYRLTRKMLALASGAGGFLLIATMAGIFGLDPATSFFSTFSSGTGLLVLWHAFLMLFMIASAVRVGGFGFLKKILILQWVASLILAVATFFTDLTINIGVAALNNSQGGAMMGNVLFLGSYLIFSVFLGVVLVLLESSRTRKIVYGIGVGIMLLSPTFFISVDIWRGLVPFADLFSPITNLLGGARAATVALALGGVVSGIVWLMTRRGRRSWWAGFMALVLLVVGLGIGALQTVRPGTRLNTFFVQESGNRLIDWRAAMAGVKEYPVLGVGPENYRIVFQKNLDPRVFDPGHGNEVWTLHPHNALLEVVVTTGILGLAGYIFMIGCLFWGIVTLYRKGVIDHRILGLLVGMLVAYLLQNMFVFDTIVSYFVLFALVGIIAGLNDLSSDPARFRSQATAAQQGIGWTGTGIIVACLIGFVFIPMGKAAGLYRLSQDTIEHRTQKYQSMFLGPGSAFVRTEATLFSDSFIKSYDGQHQALMTTSAQRAAVIKEIQALIATLDKVWQKRELDYRLSLNLLQLENLLGIFKGELGTDEQNAAYRYYERAVVLSPTDPQVYYARAFSLLIARNVTEARQMNQKALELNQNYTPAKTFKTLLDQL
jgi:O-antigen ligase